MGIGRQFDPDRRVLSVTEASTLSGYTRSNLNHLIRQGYLEAVKVGNIWLVYEDSLRRYMAAPRKPGPRPGQQADASVTSSVPNGEGNVGQ
jgi:excisionase family DNA binding protein